MCLAGIWKLYNGICWISWRSAQLHPFSWTYGIHTWTWVLCPSLSIGWTSLIKVLRIIGMFGTDCKDSSSLVSIVLGLVWPWIYHSLRTTETTIYLVLMVFCGLLERTTTHLLQSKCFIILPKGNYIDSFYVAISLWIVNTVLSFHDFQVYFGIIVRPFSLPEWEGYFIHPSDITEFTCSCTESIKTLDKLSFYYYFLHTIFCLKSGYYRVFYWLVKWFAFVRISWHYAGCKMPYWYIWHNRKTVLYDIFINTINEDFVFHALRNDC